jgi:hypothetical protein
VISYHPHLTYQNPSAVARETFYSTGLTVPYVIFDGTIVVWEANPANYDSVFRQSVEVARTTAPYFNLEITSATADTSVGRIDFMIIATDTIPESDLAANVAVLQDSLPGAYTTFYRVCQQLYTLPIEIAYPDTIDTFIVFSHTIPVEYMSAVLFVQDTLSKQIMQTTRCDFPEE